MDTIAVEHLAKTYGNGVRAVDDLSFGVHKGEIFGLLGPNGAGKSTTVRMLTTLTAPTSGRALISGRDVRREAQAVRQEIGYVAQSSGVDKLDTGRENLLLQAQLQRVPKASIAKRVEDTIAWVGLTDAADRLVDTYSGGMQRRLEIAMGLVHQPDVLFLDEPTTGLDPETRRALWRDLVLMREARQLTVLLTTHYLEEADALCDRLAIVDHGRIVAEGTPMELKSHISGDTVRLDVATRDPSASIAGALRALDGVLDVLVDENRLLVRVANGPSAVPALVTALEREGTHVHAVAVTRPSLDDVYLHHTGQHWGDGLSTAVEPMSGNAVSGEAGV